MQQDLFLFILEYDYLCAACKKPVIKVYSYTFSVFKMLMFSRNDEMKAMV